MTSRQSAGEADKLVRRYLAQLDAALQGVDVSRREEILAEVHEHIEEQGRDRLDTNDAADVRTLLDRVGDPAAIAAEAGAPSPDSRRWDAWAPWLIIFGPVASGLGWIAERKEAMSMAPGQDRLNAGNNPILRILIVYLIRRIRERRRERQLTR